MAAGCKEKLVLLYFVMAAQVLVSTKLWEYLAKKERK